jgi:hypothetical protein
MKFGIRSAVDVVFKTTRDYTGLGDDILLTPGREWDKGEPVMYFDTLKTATTEGTATTVYAQGGAGNPRLIAWEGEKTVTFTFEDALISAEGMSILAGAGLIDATADNIIRVNKKAVVSGTVASNVLTVTGLAAEILDEEELVEEDIFAFIVDEDGDIITRLGGATGTPTSENVLFAATEVADGKVLVLIDYYVEKVSGVQEVSITADQFAGNFYIEGDTLFRRQSDGKDLAAKMIIPNAKIQTAFNFSMSPAGDPSTFTFTADALPGMIKGDLSGKKKMYALQILDN